MMGLDGSLDGMVSRWLIGCGCFSARAQTKPRGSHESAWKKGKEALVFLL